MIASKTKLAPFTLITTLRLELPAYICSRGMDVKYIVTIQLRWQVPQFLSQAENKWPQVKIEEGLGLEVKTEKSFIHTVSFLLESSKITGGN